MAATPPPASGGIAEDRRLVLLAAGGDRSAFGVLVRKYARMVRALVSARLGAGADAEDAAQETFVLAFSRLDRLQDPERFAGWLSRIAVNKALETIRRSGRRRTASLDALPVDPAAPPEPDRLATREQVERMLRHVGMLDERSQVALTLRFLEGMAVKDVAAQIGDRPPAVAMRISRALRRLRDSMDGEEPL